MAVTSLSTGTVVGWLVPLGLGIGDAIREAIDWLMNSLYVKVFTKIADLVVWAVAELLDLVIEPFLELMLYSPAPEYGNGLLAPPTNSPWNTLFGDLWPEMVVLGYLIMFVSYLVSEGLVRTGFTNESEAAKREYGLVVGLVAIPFSKYVVGLYLLTMQLLVQVVRPGDLGLSTLASASPNSARIVLITVYFIGALTFLIAILINVLRITAVIIIAGMLPVLLGFILSRTPVLGKSSKTLAKGLPILGFIPVLVGLVFRVYKVILQTGGLDLGQSSVSSVSTTAAGSTAGGGFGAFGFIVQALFFIGPGLLGILLPIVLMKTAPGLAAPSMQGAAYSTSSGRKQKAKGAVKKAGKGAITHSRKETHDRAPDSVTNRWDGMKQKAKKSRPLQSYRNNKEGSSVEDRLGGTKLEDDELDEVQTAVYDDTGEWYDEETIQEEFSYQQTKQNSREEAKLATARNLKHSDEKGSSVEDRFGDSLDNEEVSEIQTAVEDDGGGRHDEERIQEEFSYQRTKHDSREEAKLATARNLKSSHNEDLTVDDRFGSGLDKEEVSELQTTVHEDDGGWHDEETIQKEFRYQQTKHESRQQAKLATAHNLKHSNAESGDTVEAEVDRLPSAGKTIPGQQAPIQRSSAGDDRAGNTVDVEYGANDHPPSQVGGAYGDLDNDTRREVDENAETLSNDDQIESPPSISTARQEIAEQVSERDDGDVGLAALDVRDQYLESDSGSSSGSGNSNTSN